MKLAFIRSLYAEKRAWTVSRYGKGSGFSRTVWFPSAANARFGVATGRTPRLPTMRFKLPLIFPLRSATVSVPRVAFRRLRGRVRFRRAIAMSVFPGNRKKSLSSRSEALV